MSDGFKPSIEASRVALGATTPVTRGTIPVGAKGAKMSLEECAKRIREGRLDPRIRAWAGKALIAAGKPQGKRAQAQALLDAFRKQTMYLEDPVDSEMIVAAKNTLCLDEHGLCIPAADCDDSCVALGSAFMSVGIVTKIIGAAYDHSGVPTHVLLAIETPAGWLRVDPSTKLNVGQSHPATKETWVDPLEGRANMTGTNGIPEGDMVGVGLLPVGMGEITTIAQRQALFDATTAQLQTAVFTLEKAINELGASLEQVEQTRRAMRPDNPFDPEPALPITGVADFMTGSGVWTQRMDTIAHQIYDTGSVLVEAGHQAIDGARKVLVDGDAQEIFLELLPSDPWSLRTVARTADDQIIGVFDRAGTLLGGFTAKGKVQTAKQIQDSIDVLKTPVGVQGVRGVGLGIPQAVIVTGIVTVGAVIVSIGVCYVLAEQAHAAAIAAKEATNQTIVTCINSGNCPADLLDIVGKNRVADQKAIAETNANDPFAKSLENAGTIAMWVAIGGAVVAGAVVLTPIVKTTLAEFRARRKHALAGGAQENPVKQLPPKKAFGFGTTYIIVLVTANSVVENTAMDLLGLPDIIEQGKMASGKIGRRLEWSTRDKQLADNSANALDRIPGDKRVGIQVEK
jgi:hypothetical protein